MTSDAYLLNDQFNDIVLSTTIGIENITSDKFLFGDNFNTTYNNWYDSNSSTTIQPFYYTNNTTTTIADEPLKKDYVFDRTDVRVIFITLYSLVFCCCFLGEYSTHLLYYTDFHLIG